MDGYTLGLPLHIYIREVHGYTDEGGELKNDWKNIFKEPLIQKFPKNFEMKRCNFTSFYAWIKYRHAKAKGQIHTDPKISYLSKQSTVFIRPLPNLVKLRYLDVPYFDEVSKWLGKNYGLFLGIFGWVGFAFTCPYNIFQNTFSRSIVIHRIEGLYPVCDDSNLWSLFGGFYRDWVFCTH